MHNGYESLCSDSVPGAYGWPDGLVSQQWCEGLGSLCFQSGAYACAHKQLNEVDRKRMPNKE